MKSWCQHIQWGSPQDQPRGGWVMYLDHTIPQVVVIPRSWKVCPICQTKRPTAAVLKAAARELAQVA